MARFSSLKSIGYEQLSNSGVLELRIIFFANLFFKTVSLHDCERPQNLLSLRVLFRCASKNKLSADYCPCRNRHQEIASFVRLQRLATLLRILFRSHSSSLWLPVGSVVDKSNGSMGGLGPDFQTVHSALNPSTCRSACLLEWVQAAPACPAARESIAGAISLCSGVTGSM